MPVAILCATAVNEGKSPIAKIANTVEIPMQNATGTFIKSNMKKLPNKIIIGQVILNRVLSFSCLSFARWF
jgi:hypothetical protein